MSFYNGANYAWSEIENNQLKSDLRITKSKLEQIKWIKCEDALPKVMEDVLVCDENGAYRVNHIFEEDHCWFYMPDTKVVAWMPIPKYEVKQNEKL